jgi:hypothetical protein
MAVMTTIEQTAQASNRRQQHGTPLTRNQKQQSTKRRSDTEAWRAMVKSINSNSQPTNCMQQSGAGQQERPMVIWMEFGHSFCFSSCGI